MSEQIQGLIDKIKAEGVEAAEKKAQDIEAAAQEKAEALIAQAKQDAEKLQAEAKHDIEKWTEASKQALKHASRDLLLSIRKEIDSTLNTVIRQEIRSTLSGEALATILSNVIDCFLKNNDSPQDIVVQLNEKDLKALKEHALAKLQKKLKQGITFENTNDVGAGFTISFDAGKSSFEFTDASLADYLSAYLNAQVAALMKEGISK